MKVTTCLWFDVLARVCVMYVMYVQCVCPCVCVYVYVCMCVCVYVCMCVYLCMCVCVYVCMCVYVKEGMSAGLTALIVGLQPILTAWFAAWIAEKVTPKQWLGLILGLLGVGLVVWAKLSLTGMSHLSLV